MCVCEGVVWCVWVGSSNSTSPLSNSFRASLEGWVSVAVTLNQCVYSQSLSIMIFVPCTQVVSGCLYGHWVVMDNERLEIIA